MKTLCLTPVNRLKKSSNGNKVEQEQKDMNAKFGVRPQKADGPGDNIEKASGCVRLELVNRWPNCLLATR